MLTSDWMPRRRTRREDESTTRTLRPGVARRPHVAMSRRQRIDCPHERRPGMAVCLHCLHANRVATRARRRRLAPAASVAAGTVVDSVSRAAPLPTPSTPVIGAILPQGRTDLPDSLFAVRSGDTVVVHFDTSPARTRRGDKFERIVRQT